MIKRGSNKKEITNLLIAAKDSERIVSIRSLNN